MDSDTDEGQPALPHLDWEPRPAYLHARELDPYHLLSNDSDVERILHDSSDDEATCDESMDLGYLERPRSCAEQRLPTHTRVTSGNQQPTR
jgi:hypothetical protein